MDSTTPTTQSPPPAPTDRPKNDRPENDRPRNDRPESSTQPLPSTARDFRTRPSLTGSSGFRVAVVIAAIVLLVVAIFVYRYVTSYEATDDAQVDGHINSIS